MKEKYSAFLILFILIGFASCSLHQGYAIQRRSFSADFNKTTSKDWVIETHTFENNLAHFAKDHIVFEKNIAQLKLSDTPLKEKQYSGAELRSSKMFKYGRFEVQMKAAESLGCITAFFLYRPNADQNTEIDFEISGKYPSVITLNHWVDKRSHDKDIKLNFDSTKEFHTYTIDWKPSQITWLIDGEIIYQTNKAVPNKAMQVVFNLWATKSEKWAGKINEKNLPTFAYFKNFKYTAY